MPRANEDIRAAIAKSRIRNYEIADKLGVSPYKLSIMLRKEMSDEVKEQIYKAIAELKEQM